MRLGAGERSRRPWSPSSAGGRSILDPPLRRRKAAEGTHRSIARADILARMDGVTGRARMTPHEAFLRLRSGPGGAEFARSSYVGDDPAGDGERFRASPEFAATLALVGGVV